MIDDDRIFENTRLHWSYDNKIKQDHLHKNELYQRFFCLRILTMEAGETTL